MKFNLFSDVKSTRVAKASRTEYRPATVAENVSSAPPLYGCPTLL